MFTEATSVKATFFSPEETKMIEKLKVWHSGLSKKGKGFLWGFIVLVGIGAMNDSNDQTTNVVAAKEVDSSQNKKIAVNNSEGEFPRSEINEIRKWCEYYVEDEIRKQSKLHSVNFETKNLKYSGLKKIGGNTYQISIDGDPETVGKNAVAIDVEGELWHTDKYEVSKKEYNISAICVIPELVKLPSGRWLNEGKNVKVLGKYTPLRGIYRDYLWMFMEVG